MVVIGAGQAGLSAAYHLQRRGFTSALEDPAGERTFVVLDANPAPGGAWQHRWANLRMRTVNRIFDLPGLAQEPGDLDEPARVAVPRYFAQFEARQRPPVLRPVRVTTVRAADDDDPAGELLVETDGGAGPRTWRTRFVLNASGTWNAPVLPVVPGAETFAGEQLHSRDYVRLEDLAGRRVAVVGGGISAVQLLEEVSQVATTFWYTRREPVWLDAEFLPETTGRDVEARVRADVEAGRPTGSVVSYTGLIWTPYAVAARERGALVRRPMFTGIEPGGVREADGSLTPVDTILWATGFRADLRHLEPLLGPTTAPDGGRVGVQVDGTQVVAEPRVQLVGFGPAQSTVGANRAGREAVRRVERLLGAATARHATRPSTIGA